MPFQNAFQRAAKWLNLYTPFIVFLLPLASSCKKHKNEMAYLDGAGFYQVLSFRSPNPTPLPTGSKLLVQVSFATQRDSVFWDSYNNAGEVFEIQADTSSSHPLIRMASKGAEGDSILLMAPIAPFFLYQFGSKELPYFCKGDSTVHVRYRIVRVWSDVLLEQHHASLEEREAELLARLSAPFTDENGILWLEGEPVDSLVAVGTKIRCNWVGTYLNGRPLENQEQFEWQAGTPDQILKGLSIVLRHMRPGQHAKIILPSSLAFGNEGSSNGTVPPYTPLVYTIDVLANN
jgi:hypothetical protein